MEDTLSFDNWYGALCQALLREGQVFTPAYRIRNEVVAVDDRRITLRSEASQSVRAGTVRSFSRRRLRDFFEQRTRFVDSMEPALDDLARAELKQPPRRRRALPETFVEGHRRRVVQMRCERSAVGVCKFGVRVRPQARLRTQRRASFSRRLADGGLSVTRRERGAAGAWPRW